MAAVLWDDNSLGKSNGDYNNMTSGGTMSSDFMMVPSARTAASGDMEGGLPYHASRVPSEEEEGVDLAEFNPLDNMRSGEPPVNLLSRQYCGILAYGVIGGMTFYWDVFQTRVLANQYLLENHNAMRPWVRLVSSWMGVFSIVIGLLSDCLPLFRYRRKSYSILGGIICFFVSIGIVIVWSLMDPSADRTGIAFIILFSGFTIGLHFSWLMTLAVTVELGQREVLDKRGQLQTMLVMFYYGGVVIANIATAATLKVSKTSAGVTSDMSLGVSALILAILSILPVPFVAYFWKEEPVQKLSTGLLMQHTTNIWEMLSHRSVYQVLIAVSIMAIFSACTNTNADAAARVTSGFTNADSNWLQLANNIPCFFAVWLWHSVLLNTNWWLVGCGGFIIAGGCNMFGYLMQINNVLRSKFTYLLMYMLGQFSNGWIYMLQVVPVTEVTPVGWEGTMIGLEETIKQVINIGITNYWAWVESRLKLDVPVPEMIKDTPHMRKNTSIATVIAFGFSTLSCLMIFFLPRQKLDAQQLRAFGGRRRLPRWIMLLAFLVLFAYGMAKTIINGSEQVAL